MYWDMGHAVITVDNSFHLCLCLQMVIFIMGVTGAVPTIKYSHPEILKNCFFLLTGQPAFCAPNFEAGGSLLIFAEAYKDLIFITRTGG